jgi:hypothetical protein
MGTAGNYRGSHGTRLFEHARGQPAPASDALHCSSRRAIHPSVEYGRDGEVGGLWPGGRSPGFSRLSEAGAKGPLKKNRSIGRFQVAAKAEKGAAGAVK